MEEIKTLEKFRDLEIGKAEILGILADKILKKKLKVEINIDNVLKIIMQVGTYNLKFKRMQRFSVIKIVYLVSIVVLKKYFTKI